VWQIKLQYVTITTVPAVTTYKYTPVSVILCNFKAISEFSKSHCILKSIPGITYIPIRYFTHAWVSVFPMFVFQKPNDERYFQTRGTTIILPTNYKSTDNNNIITLIFNTKQISSATLNVSILWHILLLQSLPNKLISLVTAAES